MGGTTLEKTTCESCGADVRENTNFCYNCGKSFAAAEIHETNGSIPIPMPDGGKAALEDLAKRMASEEAENDRLAKAALERKKARVVPKKEKEVAWQQVEPSSARLFAISVIIFLLVATIVFFAVYLK